MSDKKPEMLFEVDTLFGHVIEASADGPVYRDDGSLVDFANPRACKGCSVKARKGEHDPCIANLPGTIHACCGHGLERTPKSGGLAGYVALNDGRRIEFSGTEGGIRIREAITAALAGDELPEGFSVSNKMWWTGLTQAQIDYVEAHQRQSIFDLVRKVTHGQFPPDDYLTNDSMWYEGVSAEEKQEVFGLFAQNMAELVEQALQNA